MCYFLFILILLIFYFTNKSRARTDKLAPIFRRIGKGIGYATAICPLSTCMEVPWERPQTGNRNRVCCSHGAPCRLLRAPPARMASWPAQPQLLNMDPSAGCWEAHGTGTSCFLPLARRAVEPCPSRPGHRSHHHSAFSSGSRAGVSVPGICL